MSKERRRLRRALTVAALLCLAANGAAARAGQPGPSQIQGASAGQPSADVFPIDASSIQRIRRELRRQPRLTLSKPDRKLPVYRARIEGYEFTLPSWKDRFVMRTAPAPLGGSDFARAQWAAIAPVAWGSPMPFSSVGPESGGRPGLLDVPVLLLNKAIEAYGNRGTARARAEVRRELAEVEAHNARVAAGLAEVVSPEEKATAEKKPVGKKPPEKQAKKKDQ